MIRSRWLSLLVWLAVTPFAAWAVLRVGGWTPVWQWIMLVAFTPYVAAASVVALILALGLRRRVAAAVAGRERGAGGDRTPPALRRR